MDDTPTTLLVAERDENTRAFLLDNLAADGYEPLGAQTEEEMRVKFRNHGPALVLLGGLGERCRRLSLVRAIRSAAIAPTTAANSTCCRTSSVATAPSSRICRCSRWCAW
jgi:DNA-binding response OmpR family regulator